MAADKKGNDTKEDGVTRKLENEDDVVLIDQDHKIVGGSVVDPPFKYAFMVHGGNCGASLVAHNVLLTAAHFLRDGVFGRGVVQIGKHDLSNNQEDYEEFDVEMLVPHPDYREQDFVPDYDIMMVKLSGSSRFQPVKLDDGNEDFAEHATVMGCHWGATGVLC